MIEWNDSTQLKTKKMPRPLCLLLVGLLAWTILINGTLKLQSQARKRKKGKRRDRFFFFHIIIVKEHWQSTVFPTFSITFSKRKTTHENKKGHFARIYRGSSDLALCQPPLFMFGQISHRHRRNRVTSRGCIKV